MSALERRQTDARIVPEFGEAFLEVLAQRKRREIRFADGVARCNPVGDVF
jgi:hypothetical protein